ncbi:MAG: NUDIX domain-containing protein [Phycisphaerae bacterium]|nr:(deoxy)nucleoside triphosphate pyrophosphohydrolase [Gammaproteobacteria bacterium]NIR53199.1 (deoxy)nucleoside triphosphate pyrophosphohydrolase [candidate division KSB1 bacterium]NIV03058.1 NUDIX domain-containing protein [Phycisphaerae bacterium]NIQ12773.1 (deoxy)nucleoside triphosphate pyrophosphohydrolase [Gammaproteobacteria bacterium]NIU29164.1 (deoxy)nucleoside triphosphate pyrophosphohydrolase [candidate division KSB1 bacterium]
MKLEKSKPDHPLLVTAAVIIENGKVLITKRPADKKYPGFWEFPGGKVDPGESPQEALTREIHEELDVLAKVEGIFDVVYHCYDWGAVLILAYLCTIAKGTIRNLEVAEHCWACPEELPEFEILPADQPIIRQLLSRKV